MSSNQTHTGIPSKINELETRPAEQNQVERRRNTDKILIDNEDNLTRIINLPQQSVSDPLWNQFFNGSFFY
jgi:hypothetical protein